MIRRILAILTIAGSLSAALSAGPAGAADLAAHHAVYQLRMETARAANVSNVSGRMSYDVLDACDGWAVTQRLQMTLTNRDGQEIEMVSDYTTWESKDGLRLRYRMRQMTDTAVTSDVEGDASLPAAGQAGTAHYTVPADTTKDLPAGTLFPMAHTAALLAGAAEGKKILALPLFDGTSEKGAQDSSIAIANWQMPMAYRYADLAGLSSGRFRIAFFDRDGASQQPDYEVGMRYWENGVADDLTMDFGDFVMAGSLSEFTLTPHGC